eukprot:1475174-Rhodomonas_salina.1
MKPTNKDAPTCEWATARMPYISPAHGGQVSIWCVCFRPQAFDLHGTDMSVFVQQPVPVDAKSTRGAAVKIAGEWEGHYPSLVGMQGELVARAGTGWAVKFEGVKGEMFFNTEVGMQQLVLVPQDRASETVTWNVLWV